MGFVKRELPNLIGKYDEATAYKLLWPARLCQCWGQILSLESLEWLRGQL